MSALKSASLARRSIATLPTGPARQYLFAEMGALRLLGLDFTPHLGRHLFTLPEIFFHFFRVVQIVANHCIDIGKLQALKPLDDGFRRGAIEVGFNYQFQLNSRVSDSNGSGIVTVEWNRLRLNYRCHYWHLVPTLPGPARSWPTSSLCNAAFGVSAEGVNLIAFQLGMLHGRRHDNDP